MTSYAITEEIRQKRRRKKFHRILPFTVLLILLTVNAALYLAQERLRADVGALERQQQMQKDSALARRDLEQRLGKPVSSEELADVFAVSSRYSIDRWETADGRIQLIGRGELLHEMERLDQELGEKNYRLHLLEAGGSNRWDEIRLEVRR